MSYPLIDGITDWKSGFVTISDWSDGISNVLVAVKNDGMIDSNHSLHFLYYTTFTLLYFDRWHRWWSWHLDFRIFINLQSDIKVQTVPVHSMTILYHITKHQDVIICALDYISATWETKSNSKTSFVESTPQWQLGAVQVWMEKEVNDRVRGWYSNLHSFRSYKLCSEQ